MALNNFGLGFQVTATDQASSVFEKVGGHLGKLEKDGAASAISMQEAGESLKSMGDKFTHVGDMVTETLLAAAEHATNFQESIARAGAFANASAAELGLLHDAAMNTDMVMKGFSFEVQAKTLEALANETNNAKDAMAQLVPALTLAKVTGMDAAETAHFLSDVLSGFGKESKDAGLVVDQMAFAMKKFGLEAKELQGALMPTIGATKLVGGTFEDTLTIVGLANSQLGNVKKSAVAASMAMNQLADPATAADFARIGVAVKTSDGNFRSMLDILADVSEKTKNMTATQKAATLGSIYNAKTAGGLNIVMDQLAKGVQDASGKMLYGAEAAAELRKQMTGAKGAGEELAMAAVGTFGEQKKALVAALSSFMTVIGEPIQEMLAPIVRNVVMVIAKITKAFASLSPGFKKVAIGLFAAVGAFASFIGAALTGAGAIAGLILAGKALLIGLAGVAAVIAVLAVAMAPLILIGATLYVMWTKNIGGIADKVTAWFEKIKLAFKALYEVFTSGGFSMAVFDELNKAENSGIKAFAINAFLWFNRIKNFFMKLGESFSAGMERVGPLIERIGAAIAKLAGRFSSTTDAASTNKDTFEKWGAMGAKVGDALVRIVEFLASAFEKAINYVDGAVEVFMTFRPVLGQLWDAVKDLGKAFGELIGALSGSNAAGDTSAETWHQIGGVLAWIAGVAIEGLVVGFRALAGVISWVSGIIGGLTAFFSGMINGVILGVQMIVAIFKGDWAQAWDLAGKMVDNWVNTIVQMFLKVVAGAAGMIDSLGKLFGKDLGFKAKVEGLAPTSPTATAASPGLPASNTNAGPAASPAVAAAQGQAAGNAAVAQAVASPAKAGPVEVNSRTTLVVDGQVLADTVQKHSQNSANRSFAPSANQGGATT